MIWDDEGWSRVTDVHGNNCSLKQNSANVHVYTLTESNWICKYLAPDCCVSWFYSLGQSLNHLSTDFPVISVSSWGIHPRQCWLCLFPQVEYTRTRTSTRAWHLQRCKRDDRLAHTGRSCGASEKQAVKGAWPARICTFTVYWKVLFFFCIKLCNGRLEEMVSCNILKLRQTDQSKT